MKMTSSEYAEATGKAAPKRGNKYSARRVEVDGIRFDSKREAAFYSRLLLEQKAGEVKYFLRQVPFHLPGQTRYVVDFLIVMTGGIIRYVDVKGVETQMFKTKKRMVEDLYPVRIEVVR